MPNNINADYKTISVKRFAPNLGAEVTGADLSKPVSNEQFAEINRAFLDHQVLFFREQIVLLKLFYNLH